MMQRTTAHQSAPAASGPTPPRQSFLSQADCQDIAKRLTRLSTGGGVTAVAVWSHWSGHVNWARNRLMTSGDVRNNYVRVSRNVNGATNGMMLINQITDAALAAAVKKAERWASMGEQDVEWDLAFKREIAESTTAPRLFSDVTYQLDAEQRAAAAIALTKASAAAGVLSAGHIEVTARSMAVVDSLGHVRYVPYTQASYSVTVRDPQGAGSGWAGMDWPDWARIDASALTARALDKCLKSRNPVRVEPGRYVTILEPQSVSELVGPLIDRTSLSRNCAEWDCSGQPSPFSGTPKLEIYEQLGMTRLGQRVIDERISLWSDPMDPDAGFIPFDAGRLSTDEELGLQNVEVFHAAHWIKNGVLTELGYDREYGIMQLDQPNGQPVEGGFHMSGGTTSIEEMIATTKRGILVTKFDGVEQLEYRSLLLRGYTRDGLWLIEDGKVSKPVKNMAFTESPLFALNNVELLGVPQRVFRPANGRLTIPQPAFVPPIKVRDFSFTALTDAV